MKKNSDLSNKKMIDKVSVNEENKVASKKSHLTLKLILYLLIFFIFLSFSLYYASKILEKDVITPIKYSEKGTVDYKVYLNDNSFYNEKYLDMNKSYVASLIKYIDVNYNYLFNISEKSLIDFDYKIIGELVIENSNGTSRYLEKEYTLLDTVKKKIVDETSLSVKENIKIDYAFYNQLANSFRATYGVDTNSYLNVYMDVNANSDAKINYKIKENNKIPLRIPLSEKAIEINLNVANQNIVKQVIPEEKIVLNNKYLIIELLFLIPTCVIAIILIRLISNSMRKYTAYDKYIKKILKQYDRLIVETSSEPKMKDYHIIELNKFVELIDAHDNLQLPILYTNIKEHEEGIFYIINSKDLYLLSIKNENLSKKK